MPEATTAARDAGRRATQFALERVDSAAGLAALRDEWTRLFDVAGEGLPFQTHEWTSAWWAHFRRDGRLLRDALRVYVLRDESGQARGIAPLLLSERPARGPLRLRTLQFLGADANLTELRRPLVTPADESDVVQALLARLDGREDDWDWALVGGLGASAPLAQELVARGRGRWAYETPAYLLDLPPTWDELRARLKRNIRESLRKCYNSLARDGHGFELRVATSAGEIDESLSAFFDLHARRAAAPDAPAHSDYFASPAARAFLRDVCARLAARGATRVFVLRVGGAAVAARVGFVFGSSLYLYYSGYDPAWAEYSVMTTTLAETLRWAMASGLTCANLSTGRDVSKTRWGPREVLYRDVVVLHDGLRARALQRAFVLGERARDQALLRRLAATLGLVRGDGA